MLDVMGFRQKYAHDPDRLANLYRVCLDRSYYGATSGVFSVSDAVGKIHLVNLTVKVFSDSLFVFARFDKTQIAFGKSRRGAALLRKYINHGAFHCVLHAAGRICEAFLLEGLPIRGGIAHGKMLIDETKRLDDLSFDRSIYMGDALISAYEWQEQQDWLWYSVAPGSAHLVPKAQPMDEFCRTSVPTKNGIVETYAGMVGSWNLGDAETQFRFARNVAAGMNSAYRAGDPRHISRWRATASFLNAVGVPVHQFSQWAFEKWSFDPDRYQVVRTMELVSKG